jgi:hypothetical protein
VPPACPSEEGVVAAGLMVAAAAQGGPLRCNGDVPSVRACDFLCNTDKEMPTLCGTEGGEQSSNCSLHTRGVLLKPQRRRL